MVSRVAFGQYCMAPARKARCARQHAIIVTSQPAQAAIETPIPPGFLFLRKKADVYGWAHPYEVA